MCCVNIYYINRGKIIVNKINRNEIARGIKKKIDLINGNEMKGCMVELNHGTLCYKVRG